MPSAAKRLVPGAFLALLFVVSPAASRAADLDQVLETLVAQVRAELTDRDLKSLSIGRFDGPRTSGGRRIENELRSRLTAAGIEVVTAFEAALELRGEFSHYDVGGHVALTLSARLYDGNGVEIESFRKRFDAATEESRADLRADLAAAPKSIGVGGGAEAGGGGGGGGGGPTEAVAGEPALSTGAVVDDAQDVALLHGATVDLATAVQAATGVAVTPPKSGPGSAPAPSSGGPRIVNQPMLLAQARRAVDRSIRDAVLKPRFELASMSSASSGRESPFRIEVLATPIGRPQPYAPAALSDRGGFAFVGLKEGQLYAVKLHNDSTFDVGVELNIDGINSLALCQDEAYRRLGKWIVPAGKTGFVEGWLIDRSRLERFLITSAQQGVATELGRPQGIGMISAAFFPAWVGDDPPAFERLVAGSTRSIATGRGPVQGVQAQSAVRSFGTEPLSIVTVRYVNPQPTAD